MRRDYPSYSYRADPSVPDFADNGPRTVMDAQCSLCARGAKWIARHDSRMVFRIIPVQSELGAALLTHYDMNPEDPSSWLYLEDGEAYTSLDAVIRVGARLGGIWYMLKILRLLPRKLQDRLYGWVARNRYKLGQDIRICDMPDPDVRQRLMT